MKKLTVKEKELMGVILDYEKEHVRRAYGVAKAMGLPADVTDLVEYERIERALNLSSLGDGSIAVIHGYVFGECSLEAVFEVIEFAMNEESDKVIEWYDRHDL